MCDPFTIASAAIGIGGAAMGASGRLRAGDIEAKAATLTAEIAQENSARLGRQADIIERSADLPWLRANVAETKIRDEGERVLAGQRTHFASAFMDPAYGSPLLIQAVTAGRVQADVDLVRAGAAIEEANIMTAAANVRGQAAGQAGAALGALMKSEGAMVAAQYGAATELLSGASKLWPGLKSVAGGFGSGRAIDVGSATGVG